MLFRKKIAKACAYCAHGTELGEDRILCIKSGIMHEYGSCRKFRYDPLKRRPKKQKALDFSKYSEKDYSL